MDTKDQFSVWPLMVDMLTSILIIFILFSFFNDLLNRESIDQTLANLRRQAFIQQFDKTFRSELDNKDVKREGNLNYLKVSFSDEILFGSGEYNLNDQGKLILNRLAPIIVNPALKENVFRIQVEGHTDDSPLNRDLYPRDNWELSTARAISVVRHLSQKKRIESRLFSANGYGPNIPISKNRRINRRIELKIYFSQK